MQDRVQVADYDLEQDVDATFMGNKLRFINDANKKFTNCMYAPSTAY